MTEEEEARLNFYSKYSRVREKHAIDSLYNLIEGAKTAETLQIIQVTRSIITKSPNKASASVSPRKRKPKTPASAKASQPPKHEPSEEQLKNMQQIGQKMQQLKKMEREFHQEIEKREKQIFRRKEAEVEKRRAKQRHPINVVDNREPSPPRKTCSQIRLKKVSSRSEMRPFAEEDLDFQDYYRASPEVPISTLYENNPDNRKQLRDMLESQKLRQMEVQSLKEGRGQTNQIVLGGTGLIGRGVEVNQAEKGESRNIGEVDIFHSRSENILNQYRDNDEGDFSSCEELKLEQKMVQVQVEENNVDERKEEVENEEDEEYEDEDEKREDEDRHEREERQQVVKQRVDMFEEGEIDILDEKEGEALESREVDILEQKDAETEPKEEQVEHVQILPKENIDYWQRAKTVPKQVQSMQNINEETEQPKEQDLSVDNSCNQESETHAHQRGGPNHTVTEECSQIKQQIADKVDPIDMVEHTPYQSEHLIKTRNTTIYHSQTIANSKLHLSREVRSIATDSNNELSDRSRLIEHRKSSFKRLMAENRANLVPRMAISTILNEHINEALVDFKQQSVEPVAVQVDQGIVNTENSPKSKRKVNFKKRIVEQQHDKSYSRDSKPSFGRDPAKVEKNRMMLAGFFADN